MKPHHHLKIAEQWAKLMDDQFSILGIKFGLDPILDFLPISGDVLGAILSAYIVLIAFMMEVPQEQIGKMIVNIVLDFIIGLVPFIGTVGDVFFKANKMNLEILKKYAKADAVDGEII